MDELQKYKVGTMWCVSKTTPIVIILRENEFNGQICPVFVLNNGCVIDNLNEKVWDKMKLTALPKNNLIKILYGVK